MDNLEQELSRLTLELCQIPSPTGSEAELADFIEQWCQKNVKGKIIRKGHALVVEIGSGPVLALLGHIDTVLPGPNQLLGIIENRVYGCGASDMKSGLALMLYVLKEKATLCLPYTLRCVFYDAEEGPYDKNGLAALKDFLEDVKLAICLEPTDNEIHSGCAGSIQAQVEFMGKRAHSARPWQGKNAIFEALPFLQKLADKKPVEVILDGLSFYEVVHPTLLSAGVGRNVIPDKVAINVNYRFSPSKTVKEASLELVSWVPSDAQCTIYDAAPSAKPAHTHPWVNAWITQDKLMVCAKQAWTDVGRLALWNVSAINFGPGETAQAHQANEFVSIKNLVVGYHSIKSLLERIPN